MILWKRTAVVAGTVAALTLAIAAPAAAHVTVGSSNAVQGGYGTVTFKVPNESDQASSTKLEVTLPADAPVASVSVRPVPGWTAVTEKSKLATPLEAEGSQITETVSKITWTASGDAAIKPGQFQMFDVSMGRLPKTPQMVFKALQTYSDGTIVRWIDEPTTSGTEPENPAPVLTLAAAAGAAPAPAPAESAGPTGTAFGVIGAAFGLIALILALLAYRRSGRTAPAQATAAKREAVTTGKHG